MCYLYDCRNCAYAKSDPMNTEMANDIMSDAAEEEAREMMVIEDILYDQQEDDQI